METTIVYWGFIGIMEKKMEATIVSWDVSRTIFPLSDSQTDCSGDLLVSVTAAPATAGGKRSWKST